jgi:hypothetical protein
MVINLLRSGNSYEVIYENQKNQDIEYLDLASDLPDTKHKSFCLLKNTINRQCENISKGGNYIRISDNMYSYLWMHNSWNSKIGP